jgi:hypothetical protein
MVRRLQQGRVYIFERHALDRLVTGLAKRQGVLRVSEDATRNRNDHPSRVRLDRDGVVGSGLLYRLIGYSCHGFPLLSLEALFDWTASLRQIAVRPPSAATTAPVT